MTDLIIVLMYAPLTMCLSYSVWHILNDSGLLAHPKPRWLRRLSRSTGSYLFVDTVLVVGTVVALTTILV